MRIAASPPPADQPLRLPLCLFKVDLWHQPSDPDRNTCRTFGAQPKRHIQPRFTSRRLDWPLWRWWLPALAALSLLLLPTTSVADSNLQRPSTATAPGDADSLTREHEHTTSVPDALSEQSKVTTGQWNVRLAMGAGYRSNPLIGGKNLPLWLMPDVSYYGKKWFFDNGRVGYTAWHNDHWTLSSVLQLNEEKGYFIRSSASNWWQLRQVNYTTIGQTDINNGMLGPTRTKAAPSKVSISDVTSRPMAIDAGIQLNYQHQGYLAAATVWHDVSGSYQGAHAQLQLGHQWQHSSGVWLVSAGLRYKSRDLMQRYYGISAADAEQAGILPWHASHSWQPQWQLQWQYPLTADWNLHAMWQQQRLDDATTASPLVDTATIHRWFVGASYRFW